MKIQYLGHSMFHIKLENGISIVMDPYGDLYKYPKRSIKADIVTVSHHHHDHDAMWMIQGEPDVLDLPGSYNPADDIQIEGIDTFHDECSGAKRGKNTVFVIRAEGLSIVHLGDLGHQLSQAQLNAIGSVDILLLPIGGTYTLDATGAMQCARMLQPGIVVPMHYQTDYNRDMPICTEVDFLKMMGEKTQTAKDLIISKETKSSFAKIVLLEIAI